MSSALDAIVDQIADAVARRVVEMQRAAAAKKRTLYLTPPPAVGRAHGRHRQDAGEPAMKQVGSEVREGRRCGAPPGRG